MRFFTDNSSRSPVPRKRQEAKCPETARWGKRQGALVIAGGPARMRGGVVEGRKGLEWSNKQQHGDDVPLRCATSARRQQTMSSFQNPFTWRTSGNFRGLRS